MATIKLKTCDGVVFTTDILITKCSNTITTLLHHFNVEDHPDEFIELANVNSPTLELILKWAEHHKNDTDINPIQLADTGDILETKNSKDISPWDEKFLNLEIDALFDLIMAANYMDIKDLLEVSCKAVANMIKGKSAYEIRKTFNIKNDFTNPRGMENQKRK